MAPAPSFGTEASRIACTVLGISGQDVESHVAFKQDLDLPFPLLADEGDLVLPPPPPIPPPLSPGPVPGPTPAPASPATVACTVSLLDRCKVVFAVSLGFHKD